MCICKPARAWLVKMIINAMHDDRAAAMFFFSFAELFFLPHRPIYVKSMRSTYVCIVQVPIWLIHMPCELDLKNLRIYFFSLYILWHFSIFWRTATLAKYFLPKASTFCISRDSLTLPLCTLFSDIRRGILYLHTIPDWYLISFHRRPAIRLIDLGC